jgi:hypothetical protein
MVKVRKLTMDLVANFPYSSAERVLQTNGLFEMEDIFWGFFWYKIGQNRAKVCKSVQKNDRKGRFFPASFIKTCQVRRLVSICNWRSLFLRTVGNSAATSRLPVLNRVEDAAYVFGLLPAQIALAGC